MGASNESPIGKFVNRLVTEKHIKPGEKDIVQNFLESLTSEITDIEKEIVVRSLNKKLDAASSDLITPQGVNFASLEKSVVEVTNKIIEQKENKREAENRAKQVIDESLQIKEEAKKEDKKEDNDIGKIDEWLKGFGFVDTSMLSDDFKRKVAEEKEKNDAREKEFQEALKETGSEEAALESVFGKIWQKQIENGVCKYEMIIDMLSKIYEEAEKQKKPPEQIAEEFLKNDKSLRTVALKSSWKRDKELKGVPFFKWIKVQFKRLTIKEESAKMAEHDENLKKHNNGKLKGLSDLKKIVEEREDSKLKFREYKKDCNKLTGKIIYPEVTRKNKELCNEIVEKYIMTGRTISDIYEEYKFKNKIGDLEFEDVLDGVKENLEKDMNIFTGKQAVDAFIEHERECRRLDILVTEYEKHKSVSMVKTEDLEILNNSKIDEDRKSLLKQRQRLFEDRNFRESLRKKRKLEDKKIYSPRFGKVIEDVKDLPSSEEMLENVNAIIEDRNAIIRIAESEGITTDEAFEKYLSENEDFLNRYTEEEKMIMGITGEEITNSDFLSKITNVLNLKMYKSIESLNYEIRMSEREWGWNEGEDRKELSEKSKILNEKLTAIENSQKSLESYDRTELALISSKTEDEQKKMSEPSPVRVEDLNIEQKRDKKIKWTNSLYKVIHAAGTTFGDIRGTLNELSDQVNDRSTSDRSSDQTK